MFTNSNDKILKKSPLFGQMPLTTFVLHKLVPVILLTSPSHCIGVLLWLHLSSWDLQCNLFVHLPPLRHGTWPSNLHFSFVIFSRTSSI